MFLGRGTLGNPELRWSSPVADQGLPAPARFEFQIGVIMTLVPVSSAWIISPRSDVHGHVPDVSGTVVVEEEISRLQIRKRHRRRDCHLARLQSGAATLPLVPMPTSSNRSSRSRPRVSSRPIRKGTPSCDSAAWTAASPADPAEGGGEEVVGWWEPVGLVAEPVPQRRPLQRRPKQLPLLVAQPATGLRVLVCT